MKVGVKVTCLVVMSMLVASPMAVEGLSCHQVATYLVPCISYLIWGCWSSASVCCNGVGSLKTSAETPDDHRTACRCLINDVASIPGVDMDVADDLP
ncbi:Non-specific lipid-transfer protein [Vitis vinifera]|uniref:Non-specific lipid-transfer protein n=1 Tax=Vitis vinifera TaxID=29760 RepID=A0A438IVJ9_VITVI|nr:Non-specific lipid-transfer protein [Vitis vinifera]